MANKVLVTIGGEEYPLVADESAAYMQRVGAYVSDKMDEVIAQIVDACRREDLGHQLINNET